MRSRRLIRCPGCGLSQNLCVCPTLPRLSPKTRVVILSHRIELSKSTNTGKLVARMLGERAELALSDADWQPSASADEQAWVLFPSDDALPLEAVATQVRTLIVPDGTWAQARRIARRHARCRDLPKLRLSGELRSAYTLRRSFLKTGLCTLEAVAQALRVLEGDACAEPMLDAFAGWVARALRVRAGAHDMRSDSSAEAVDAHAGRAP